MCLVVFVFLFVTFEIIQGKHYSGLLWKRAETWKRAQLQVLAYQSVFDKCRWTGWTRDETAGDHLAKLSAKQMKNLKLDVLENL